MSHGYIGLPDADRWAFMVERSGLLNPPPRHSIRNRVSRHGNALFHLGSPVISITEVGEAVEIETPEGAIRPNLIVFAAGAMSIYGGRSCSLKRQCPALARPASRPRTEQRCAGGSCIYLPGRPSKISAEAGSACDGGGNDFPYPLLCLSGCSLPRENHQRHSCGQSGERSVWRRALPARCSSKTAPVISRLSMNHDAAEITGEEWRDGGRGTRPRSMPMAEPALKLEIFYGISSPWAISVRHGRSKSRARMEPRLCCARSASSRPMAAFHCAAALMPGRATTPWNWTGGAVISICRSISRRNFTLRHH